MKEKIIVDGLLTGYQKFNGEAKKSLLLLHGWQSDSNVWNDVSKSLGASGYAIYALDLPGFGDTQAPSSPFGVSDYAKFVEHFCAKIGLKEITLVGHSFGGRISIKLAATNPTLVKKLALVASAGIILSKKSTTRFLAGLARPLFKPKFMQSIRATIYKRLGSSDYIESGKLKETYLKIINEDLREYLPKITEPTLLIWGDQDTEAPIEIGKLMNENIKDSQMVVLDGVGHFSFLERPEDFIKILTEFINA